MEVGEVTILHSERGEVLPEVLWREGAWSSCHSAVEVEGGDPNNLRHLWGPHGRRATSSRWVEVDESECQEGGLRTAVDLHSNLQEVLLEEVAHGDRSDCEDYSRSRRLRTPSCLHGDEEATALTVKRWTC